jgi:hypothetical protein
VSVSVSVSLALLQALDVAAPASLASLGSSLNLESHFQTLSRPDPLWSSVTAVFPGLPVDVSIKMSVDDHLVASLASPWDVIPVPQVERIAFKLDPGAGQDGDRSLLCWK